MARADIRGWASRHPVASFFALAYAISWLGWLPTVLGYRGDLDQNLSMIAQFGPAVAALVLAWCSGASVRAWARQIVRWRASLRWLTAFPGEPVAVVLRRRRNRLAAGLVPGTILIDYFLGINGMDFIVPILAFSVLFAFGLLMLTLFSGFAYDVQRRIDLRKTPRWATRPTS